MRCRRGLPASTVSLRQRHLQRWPNGFNMWKNKKKLHSSTWRGLARKAIVHVAFHRVRLIGYAMGWTSAQGHARLDDEKKTVRVEIYPVMTNTLPEDGLNDRTCGDSLSNDTHSAGRWAEGPYVWRFPQYSHIFGWTTNERPYAWKFTQYWHTRGRKMGSTIVHLEIYSVMTHTRLDDRLNDRKSGDLLSNDTYSAGWQAQRSYEWRFTQ